MAFSKILFLIVSQLMLFVHACKFAKEAKSEIKLGYDEVEKGLYNLSNLSLTFENASKIFECDLNNGKQIKLSLNYKVKNKPISREFKIKYEKAKTKYIEYFPPLDNLKDREYCRLLDFRLKSEKSELALGSFYFPGAGEVKNLRFEEEIRGFDLKWDPEPESCSDGVKVERSRWFTKEKEVKNADKENHQVYYENLDSCLPNEFKVFQKMTLDDGTEVFGKPAEFQHNATLDEKSSFNLTDLYLRSPSSGNNSTKNEYKLEIVWPHIHNCVNDYDIEISYTGSNGSIPFHVKHNTIGSNVSLWIKRDKPVSVCQTYNVTIKPGNPLEKEGKWYNGMKRDLKYADFSLLNVTLMKSNDSDETPIAIWDDLSYQDWLIVKYKVFVKVKEVEIGHGDFHLFGGPLMDLNRIPGFYDKVEDCTNFTLIISPVLPKDSDYKVLNDFVGDFYKDINCDGDPYLVVYIIVGIILGLLLVALVVAAIMFYRRKKAKELESMMVLRDRNTQEEFIKHLASLMTGVKFVKPPEVPPHLDQSHPHQSQTSPAKIVMDHLGETPVPNNIREILI